MTDHYFNFIFLKNCKKVKYPKNVSYRPFTDKNISKFNQALIDADISQIYNMTCPNMAYQKLTDKYNEILNEVIPLKTKKNDKYKHNFNPWVTKGVRLSIKHRDKLHSKTKKAKNKNEQEKLRRTYYEYRTFLSKTIKNAKRIYENERFEKCKKDSKKMWSNITSVLGNSNNRRHVVVQINDENGVTLSSLKDISNEFNKYYVNVGHKLANQIGQTDIDHRSYLQKTNHITVFIFFLRVLKK